MDINIPPKGSVSNLVTLYGPKESVQKCRYEILNLIAQLKNQKSLFLRIPHKFHAQIITEYIPKLFVRFPHVHVEFPHADDSHIDGIKIQGDHIPVSILSQELDRLAAILESGEVTFEYSKSRSSDGRAVPACGLGVAQKVENGDDAANKPPWRNVINISSTLQQNSGEFERKLKAISKANGVQWTIIEAGMNRSNLILNGSLNNAAACIDEIMAIIPNDALKYLVREE